MATFKLTSGSTVAPTPSDRLPHRASMALSWPRRARSSSSFCNTGTPHHSACPDDSLHVLGLIPPPVAPSASDPNIAVRDIILGLKEVRKNLGWQGDMGKVTIGGQSTGGSLIRGELSVFLN